MVDIQENDPVFRRFMVNELFSQLDQMRVQYAIKGEPGTLSAWCEARTRKDLDIWVKEEGWPCLSQLLKKLNFIPVYSWTENKKTTPNSAMFIFLNQNGFSGGCLDFSIGDLRAGRITLSNQTLISNHIIGMEDGKYFHGVGFLLDFFLRRLLRGKSFTKHQYQIVRATWNRLSENNRDEFMSHCQSILTKSSYVRLMGALRGTSSEEYTFLDQFILRCRTLLKAILERPSSVKDFAIDTLTQRRASRKRLINPAGAKPRSVKVALLGTDGSGKSSLAKAICEHAGNVNLPAELIYYGRVRGGLIGNSVVHRAGAMLLTKNDSRDKKSPDNQTQKRRPPQWAQYIASWAYVVDYALRNTYISVRQIVKRNSLIFDRYSYDLHIMPNSSITAAKISTIFSPVPDIVCVLNPAAKVILARSDENSLQEISRQQTILKNIFHTALIRSRVALYIDNEMPLNALSLTVSRLVLLLSMEKEIDNKRLIQDFALSISSQITKKSHIRHG